MGMCMPGHQENILFEGLSSVGDGGNIKQRSSASFSALLSFPLQFRGKQGTSPNTLYWLHHFLLWLLFHRVSPMPQFTSEAQPTARSSLSYSKNAGRLWHMFRAHTFPFQSHTK